MTRRTIGIDCGLNGALALIVDGELVKVEDMPTVTPCPLMANTFSVNASLGSNSLTI